MYIFLQDHVQNNLPIIAEIASFNLKFVFYKPWKFDWYQFTDLHKAYPLLN